jgi:hypothetical protein
MEKPLLCNSYHRTCLNYAQIAAFVYECNLDNKTSSQKINKVIKRDHESKSTLSIFSFRNVLKYKGAVPHLVRLLLAGGVWGLDIEMALKGLVKIRIEEVRWVCS